MLALAGVYVWQQIRRTRYVARFSNVSLLASIAPKRPGWRRHVTFALLLASLAVLTIGVAQPTSKVRVPREKATVMVAIDVSISMKATDVLPDRLDAAKKAAEDFADILPPKINLGLVSFAGSASLRVPPPPTRQLQDRRRGARVQESTAIGEAVFSCLDAVQTFTRNNTAANEKPAPARVVLLIDGTNNTGPHRELGDLGGQDGGRSDLHHRLRHPGRHDRAQWHLPTCARRHPGPAQSGRVDRRQFPHRGVGRGTVQRLQGHRLPDRVHHDRKDISWRFWASAC